MRKQSAPHPEEPLQDRLSPRTVQVLKKSGVRTMGDLQLLTEGELSKKVTAERLQEIKDLFAEYEDCRFRKDSEQFHLRARKVFEGLGTAFISTGFLQSLGKDRVAVLTTLGTRSIGAVTRLTRQGIDNLCRPLLPLLSDSEFEQLREEIRKLGLKPPTQ